MEYLDFVSNRTTGTPSSIFKTLGDNARLYSFTLDNATVRTSNISLLLDDDFFETIHGITLTQIQSMCTDENKSKRFKVVKSKLMSTQVCCATNTIEGDFSPSILLHNTHNECVN